MIDAAVYLRREGLAGLLEARPLGVPVLDTWDTVQSSAGHFGLTEDLKVFARPSVTRGNGVIQGEVVWYGFSGGVVTRLFELGPAERSAVEAALSTSLANLQPLLQNPVAGTLFSAWLNIPSVDDDVLVVNGRPVITNWGLLPADVAHSRTTRLQHFERGIGRFLPKMASPPVFDDEPQPAATVANQPASSVDASAGRASQSSTPEGDRTGAAAMQSRVTEIIVTNAPSLHAWKPVAIAVAIAALLLLILLIPGVLIYPTASAPERRVDPDLIAQTRQTLEARLRELQLRLREGQCVPPSGASTPATPGPPTRPSGTGPSETTPPTPPSSTGPGNASTPSVPGTQPSTANRPATQPLIPPAPHSVAGPPSSGGRPGTLISHLDAVTVLIIAPQADGSGASFGTGFFVNDRHIATNQHVIANANPSKIIVINNLKKAIPGRVAASTRGSEIGGDDFAVIEVAAEQGRAFMTLTNRVERGDSVVAAGYPTFVMRNDIGFQRMLKNSDFSSIPEPAVTQGWVTALQTSERRRPVLVHGATISKGNSGGPLADMCGRAVGVNTYGDVDRDTALRLNFALRTEGLRSFLHSQQITTVSVDNACEPVSATLPATAASAPPAGSPGPAAPAAQLPVSPQH